MNTKFLTESATEAPVKNGNRWRVIVARPGKGSSGTYSEDMFRRDAHKIIAPGGQAFINHESSRNPKDMLGIYPDGSFWSEEDRAVVSELEVFSHWKAFVEEVGPHCGISLYALGESDDDGNVTSIIEDRMNGADLVARPGLVGSGLAEKLYESAVQHDSEKPSAASVQEKEKEKMELEKIVADLAATVNTFIASQTSGQKAEAQAEVDAEAIATATVTAVEAYDAKIALIEGAREALTKSQVASLREAAKSGSDVAPLIESAKATAAEFAELYKDKAGNEGRVQESAAADLPTVSGWGA